jgi:xylan 1,4-beta-xylosidase
MKRTKFFLLSLFLILASTVLTAQDTVERVVVKVNQPMTRFPHFWEQMFGSGRAVLSLRDSYRQDLRATREITDFQYVRFHAIFHDEVGIYDEDEQGHPIYNFSYVDQIYDGLLANGVRPLVELSFMPRKLATKETNPDISWYRPSTSPPKDWAKWDDLIYQFATHLVNRYGADEVARWYFEVWNEPNIGFWGGDPFQATYFDLYDHTAQTLKRVNSRIRVGGPASAQAAWVVAFLQHCSEKNIPVDFVSTHVYGNDTSEDVFRTHETIPRDKMVCRAVKKVHDEIQASSFPHLALLWTEFNASAANEPDVTDSTYMGPWLADTIRQCDGLVDMMSYWTFSDVFEEGGVVKQPFFGGYGLIAAGGIPKPAFNDFKLLHLLGEERLAVASDSVLATRRKDGSLVVAAWNLGAPGKDGPHKKISLQFDVLPKSSHAYVWQVDHEHGDFHATYEKMNSPRYPDKAQIEALRKAVQLPAPRSQPIHGNQLELVLPRNGLAVVEIK